MPTIRTYNPPLPKILVGNVFYTNLRVLREPDPPAHLRRACVLVCCICYQPLQTYGLHHAHHAIALSIN